LFRVPDKTVYDACERGGNCWLLLVELSPCLFTIDHVAVDGGAKKRPRTARGVPENVMTVRRVNLRPPGNRSICSSGSDGLDVMILRAEA